MSFPNKKSRQLCKNSSITHKRRNDVNSKKIQMEVDIYRRTPSLSSSFSPWQRQNWKMYQHVQSFWRLLILPWAMLVWYTSNNRRWMRKFYHEELSNLMQKSEKSIDNTNWIIMRSLIMEFTTKRETLAYKRATAAVLINLLIWAMMEDFQMQI